jgi:hypothetical protein
MNMEKARISANQKSVFVLIRADPRTIRVPPRPIPSMHLSGFSYKKITTITTDNSAIPSEHTVTVSLPYRHIFSCLGKGPFDETAAVVRSLLDGLLRGGDWRHRGHRGPQGPNRGLIRAEQAGARGTQGGPLKRV